MPARELNVELKVEPIDDAAAKITIEIKDAIIAYSMAVAPDLSKKKRPKKFRTVGSIALKTRVLRESATRYLRIPWLGARNFSDRRVIDT